MYITARVHNPSEVHSQLRMDNALHTFMVIDMIYIHLQQHPGTQHTSTHFHLLKALE